MSKRKPKTKSQILAKAAKRRGIPVIEIKLGKMKPEDFVGIPFYPRTDGETIIMDELPTASDEVAAEIHRILLAHKLSVDQMIAVVIHEWEHKKALQRHNWNLAADYVINDLLHHYGAVGVPGKGKSATIEDNEPPAERDFWDQFKPKD